MKADARRQRTLDRIARLRRIERVQALNGLAHIAAEAARAESLQKRSRAMLAQHQRRAPATSGHGLNDAMTYQSQLSQVSAETAILQTRTKDALREAGAALSAAERRLEQAEERADANARALTKQAALRSAVSTKMARRLLNHSQVQTKQGNAR